MAYTVILHISGETSVAGKWKNFPSPRITLSWFLIPRQRDGKDLHYLDQNVTKVIWPIAKVSFIEILESAEEEKIIGFVRD